MGSLFQVSGQRDSHLFYIYSQLKQIIGETGNADSDTTGLMGIGMRELSNMLREIGFPPGRSRVVSLEPLLIFLNSPLKTP